MVVWLIMCIVILKTKILLVWTESWIPMQLWAGWLMDICFIRMIGLMKLIVLPCVKNIMWILLEEPIRCNHMVLLVILKMMELFLVQIMNDIPLVLKACTKQKNGWNMVLTSVIHIVIVLPWQKSMIRIYPALQRAWHQSILYMWGMLMEIFWRI